MPTFKLLWATFSHFIPNNMTPFLVLPRTSPHKGEFGIYCKLYSKYALVCIPLGAQFFSRGAPPTDFGIYCKLRDDQCHSRPLGLCLVTVTKAFHGAIMPIRWFAHPWATNRIIAIRCFFFFFLCHEWYDCKIKML